MKKILLTALFLMVGMGLAHAQSFSSGTITRPNNTTTYTANTGWSNATSGGTYFTFPGVCNSAGENILLPEIDVYSSANPATLLNGILWIFRSPPASPLSDNATFNITAADYANLATLFGGISFTLTAPQASGAANSGVSLTGTNYMAQCAANTTTLYGMVQVVNAYVPAANEKLTVVLHGVSLISGN